MRVFKETSRDTAERLDSFIERMAPTAELVQHRFEELLKHTHQKGQASA
ncbi:MAG: hypothetical protein IKG65_04025 [Exiguobacterium sp.]|nr:hypothetical protein [Exiguobacterium sp.]MBR2680380.1 hypothetical protein [Exiguobacterium sp.]MBR3061584.1 hypothetical protein [Exiguobacterium sp.]MBR3217061.1 hypothetical protein [Exiguobacterium sp.]MBR3320966.1 hypothetical protein [Exiguobacterium sp.]